MQELTYPTHVLDLMTLCWSHDPSDRPSAAEIVAIATRPEFCHLQMAVCVEGQLEVTCACSAPFVQNVPAESPMMGKFSDNPRSVGQKDCFKLLLQMDQREGSLRQQ